MQLSWVVIANSIKVQLIMYHSKVLMFSAKTLAIIQLILIYVFNVHKLKSIFDPVDDEQADENPKL